MPLIWNEIKKRALRFSKKWIDEENEKAEASSFWNDFFDVFGVDRKDVGFYERKVKKLDNKFGYIDLFWPGMLIVEHKSRGKDLEKAFEQAGDYFLGLDESEKPRYIIVSDFERIRLYDLEKDTEKEIKLKFLHKHIKMFGFIAGYKEHVIKEEDPVNIRAAELMGKLYDRLKVDGYRGHPLKLMLVRLLFCLFADDTSIFNKGSFEEFIDIKTRKDGSDLGAMLSQLFQVLDTESKERSKSLDEHLDEFPYINGDLFRESLRIASFTSEMRNILLEASTLDWSAISPAIFGSLFQSVMNSGERRNLGAHYTSEKNILKLIHPLFLDELLEEFESIKNNNKKLLEFHNKLSNLKFLDPACGCGNFLIIAYRELRFLEIETIKRMKKASRQSVLDIKQIIKVNVDQFYGIEIEEFPARIAQVAMWLIDHQMNIKVSEEFGEYYVRLPLRKSAKIVIGNALTLNWEDIVSNQEISLILGNPPFIGSRLMNKEQKKETKELFKDCKSKGELDYVTGWYTLAAKYIQGTKIRVAFVSTNSISQGLQVGILWEILLSLGISINFAHRTFRWSNQAKGKAAVYCVIIGFSNFNIEKKFIFSYEHVDSEPTSKIVKTINPYLVEGRNILISSRSKPIATNLIMVFGNMPADGGRLLFTRDEKREFIREEPGSEKYFKRLISAKEFLRGIERWCLWLKDANPGEIRKMNLVMERINEVREIRKKSSRPHLAEIPSLFAQITQPEDVPYLLIPCHSSERRNYIPMGFFTGEQISHNSCLIIPNADLFHFGVLQSKMHMTWVKYICGRLESRYRYSKNVVYNNYPWTKNPSEKNIAKVKKWSEEVLKIRKEFTDSSLADLYDPSTMPSGLVKAHHELDKAVDLCYRPQSFPNENNRIEYLFKLYEEYVSR